MNKVYEQWKQVLASPAVLVSISLLALILPYFVVSFLLNLIYAIVGLLSFITHYGFTGVGEVWSTICGRYATDFIGQFFLQSKYPIFEVLVLLIVYCLVFWFVIRRLYKMRIAYKDINKGTKGTIRWMYPEEMLRTYEAFDIESDEYQLEYGGYPVAVMPDRKTMLVETDNTNLKVVGTTQAARKTQLIFYWILYLNAMAKQPSSMLINDLKGDMLMQWLGARQKEFERFDTYALNFNDPTNSMHYNPFSVVWKYVKAGKMDDAEIALQGIAKQLFSRQDNRDEDFVSGASATFTAVALVLMNFAQEFDQPEWFTLAGFYDLVLTYNKNVVRNEREVQLLDEYMKAQAASSSIAKYYMTASSATLKQKQSFYFILSSTLKDFALTSILELTSRNDLDFEQMAFPSATQKPILVFITSPYINNIFEKLQGLFYTQYLEVITKAAQRVGNQKLYRRNRVLLDEVQNSSRIEGLGKAMNVGQQMGLTVDLGIQSYAGFEENYPGKEGKGILGGAPGTMYLISDDPDDAEDASKRLGQSTVVTFNRLGDPLDVDKSYTEMEEERRLMLPDEMMKLAQDETVYFNVKKRRDKEGRDVVPHPIYARKERITKNVINPSEPLWKKSLGIASRRKETTFKSYMELIPAFEHLFKGKGHEFFDNRGLGSSDVDLRRGVKLNEYGQEVKSDLKRHIVPHEIVDLTFRLVLNKKNPEYNAMKRFEDERRLHILKEQIVSGKYYDYQTQRTEVVDNVPQDLSEEFQTEALEIPNVDKEAPETLEPQGNDDEESADFSADKRLLDVMFEEYNEIFKYLTPEQQEYFQRNIQTLGDLNDKVLISDKISDENKKHIEALINKARQRRMKGAH